jgi:16S rRNA (cytidine1402-2'-O)-methyltransferase
LSGTLLVIATPIGNLNDISLRLKQSILDCDLIFAEDTRVSKKLLSHLGIQKTLISCHNFNEHKRQALLAEIAKKNQTVALISDAGTPLISDPGYEMVATAISLDMQVIPIPGPSACIAALVASGMPTNRFAFEGFLPEKTSERKKHLQKIKDDDRTLIFYISPHSLQSVIKDLLAVLGNRKACLAREITKIYEEFIRDTLHNIAETLNTRSIKGECCLIVSGADKENTVKISDSEIKEKIQDLLTAGGRLKDISVSLATEYNLPSSYIYKLGLLCSKEDMSGENQAKKYKKK